MTYTMLRVGVPEQQITAGPDVTFDADGEGVILGARCRADVDWVRPLIQLVQAGKIRIYVED